MEIIPAINAENFDEVVKKINALKELTREFHLDVAAKDFANTETWRNFNDLKKLPAELKIDLHLMLRLKPQEILAWSKPAIKRLILHLEASDQPGGLLRLAKRTKKEIWLGLSPLTEPIKIEKYLKFIDGVLVLGVEPGKAGQEFLIKTYDRLTWVKTKINPKQKLMVDGGVKKSNLEQIAKFSPDFIVIASAIYGQDDPSKNYLELLELKDKTCLSE